jgi:hypothetical protein
MAVPVNIYWLQQELKWSLRFLLVVNNSSIAPANSMQQAAIEGANSVTSTQEIVRIIQNPQVH